MIRLFEGLNGYDETARRSASVHPLKRERESTDGFVLMRDQADETVEFEYAPDGKGGIYCQVATLVFRLADGDKSVALQKAIEQHLRATLGKPKRRPGARNHLIGN